MKVLLLFASFLLLAGCASFQTDEVTDTGDCSDILEPGDVVQGCNAPYDFKAPQVHTIKRDSEVKIADLDCEEYSKTSKGKVVGSVKSGESYEVRKSDSAKWFKLPDGNFAKKDCFDDGTSIATSQGDDASNG